MSIVRSLTFSLLATVLAASAQAAPANSSRHAIPVHAVNPAEVAKRAACERVWSVQKVRHGTHQGFVAACVAKG